VITMPSGVFKPYAGVSTAILLFTKGGETNQTWFYEMQSDGYSLDDKRNKLDGCGDLQDIVERVRKRDTKKDRDRTQKYFFVQKDELVENGYDLSLSKYKEEVYEMRTYEEPERIISTLKEIELSITNGLSEIEQLTGWKKRSH